MSTLSYRSRIVEVLEGSSVNLHGMVAAVVHRNHKVEEVTLPHILRGLLLKASRNQLMTPEERNHSFDTQQTKIKEH